MSDDLLMSEPQSRTAPASLAAMIVDQVEQLIHESEQQNKPLELDPFRGRLFEVFVTAEASGLVDDEAEPDLTADGICQALSQRWGLKDAARNSLLAAGSLSAGDLQQMRSLWSVMRMWMEWSYAWQRWHEFHPDSTTAPFPFAARESNG